jgi:hypothetical protein
MATSNRGRRTTNADTVDFRRMVGPDIHRPGPAYTRLLTEQIPVWAIIGHVGAVANTTEPAAMTDKVIALVAADYDIPHEAVLAALLYYQEFRGAIDALLKANVAAIA